MDDKRTPMEAEVQELPPKREPAKPGNFYGTAAKPKPRRNHTGFLITLSLILIVASTVSILDSIFHIRLEINDGVWQLRVQMPAAQQPQENPIKHLEPVSDSPYSPTQSSSVDSVQLQLAEGDGEALSPSEIYAQTASAVVCVQLETYYGVLSYTGVLISEDGYVLSATEGLTNATAITVSCSDGRQYAASRVGEDRVSGLCLLKLDTTGMPHVTFAQDEVPSVGQTVYCICNPYGNQLPNVFYDGMLAAQGDLRVSGYTYTLLQTSAQLGNVGYGCPILDSRGLVVGLTTPIGEYVVSGENPCFAVSAPDLNAIIDLLQHGASSQSGWLGLEVEEIPEYYRQLFRYPGSIWISVLVAPYDCLFQHDIITAVEDTEVNSVEEFEQAVSAYTPGDMVWITIFRSGEWYRVHLRVLAR